MPEMSELPRLLHSTGAIEQKAPPELCRVKGTALPIVSLERGPELIQTVRATRRLKVMCISVPEAGHLIPTAQVANALALRGHKVQLVSLACAAGKVSKSCAESGCEFVGLAPDVEAAESERGQAAALQAKKEMVRMFVYYDERMQGPLRSLMLKEQPDMILADFITPCAWELAEECGIPVVVNVPGPLSMFATLSYFKTLMMTIKFLNVSRAEAWAAYGLFGRLLPALHSKHCLFNTFIGLDEPQHIRTNFMVTGPTAPRLSKSCGQLQDTSSEAFNDWLSWVRSEGLRVVYVTMGSMQKLEDFQVKALYDGLAAIPNCGVAWSLKADQQAFLPTEGVDGLPKRFYIRSWMPQNEALQLPDVALVISHCGFGGLTEIITAGKPVVATPFRADQPANAALANQRGMAEVLDTEKLTAESVEEAVTKVLKDESYARSAKEMQKSLLKTGGAETCVDALELLAQTGCQKSNVKNSVKARSNFSLLIPVLVGAGVAAAFRFRGK